MLREDLLGRRLLVLGGRDPGDAGEHRDAALAVELLHQPLGPQGRLQLVGAGDGRHGARVALQTARAEDDGDLLLRRSLDLALDARSHRHDDHRVRILGGELLDVVDLLGRVAVGRRVQDVHVALLGVVLERLLVLERPRVRRPLRGERDPVLATLGRLLVLARIDVAELDARRLEPGEAELLLGRGPGPVVALLGLRARSAGTAAAGRRGLLLPRAAAHGQQRRRGDHRNRWCETWCGAHGTPLYRLDVRCWSQAASRIAAPSTPSWPPMPAPSCSIQTSSTASSATPAAVWPMWPRPPVSATPPITAAATESRFRLRDSCASTCPM